MSKSYHLTVGFVSPLGLRMPGDDDEQRRTLLPADESTASGLRIVVARRVKPSISLARFQFPCSLRI
jgi:hypothetical protein